MANEILMTAEGYEQLKNELYVLRTVKREEIAEKIKIARGFGDLSENSEYDEAKNEQAEVETRIAQIEEQLRNVRIIEKDQISKDVVSIGTRVKILDMAYGDELEYLVTSSAESNSSMSTITDESPVGKALLGHKVGDIVDVQVPSGSIEKFKILNIDL